MTVCICAPYNCRFQMEIKERWGQTRLFAELMLDKRASSVDRENLHEVFLTMMKIERNNKNQYYFGNFRRKKKFVFIVLLLPHGGLKRIMLTKYLYV